MKSKGAKLLEQRKKRNKLYSCYLKKKKKELNAKEREVLLAAEEQDVLCGVVGADVWNKDKGRGALWYHCLAASGYLSQTFSQATQQCQARRDTNPLSLTTGTRPLLTAI